MLPSEIRPEGVISMKLTSIAILTAACCLAGCTLPKTTTTTTSPITPYSGSVTGNWELTANSTAAGYGNGGDPIGIYLTQSGSTVSGIAWVQEAFPMCIGANGIPCAFPFGVINTNLTGTIDSGGNITLGSATGGSSPVVFSIAAAASTDGTLTGTYSITQTTPLTTASDSGTITGNMIAPLNGTYAGTVVSTYTGQSMGVTTTLNQTAAPDSNGFLRVTASATTFTGSPCLTTLVMAGPAATYSGFLGSAFSVTLVSTTNANDFVGIGGGLSPDAKTMQVYYGTAKLPGGTCTDDYGEGTLTRQ